MTIPILTQGTQLRVDELYLNEKQEDETYIRSNEPDGWNVKILFALRQNVKNSSQYLYFEQTVTRNPKEDGSFTTLPRGTML